FYNTSLAGVSAANGGGFIAAWGSTLGAAAQSFDATGAPIGASSSFSPASSYDVSVAALAGGGYAVGWDAAFSPLSSAGYVFLNIVNSQGDIATHTSTVFPDAPFIPNTIFEYQENSAITGLPNGNVAVVYVDNVSTTDDHGFTQSNTPTIGMQVFA